jgi:hypothetical protein
MSWKWSALSRVVAAALLVCVIALLGAAQGVKEEQPLRKLPAGLALVAPDAGLFITVKPGDLLAHPTFALLDRPFGSDFAGGFEREFGIPMKEVQRLTLFGQVPDELIVVVHTREPFAREKLIGKEAALELHGKKVFRWVPHHRRTLKPQEAFKKDKDGRFEKEKDRADFERELALRGELIWPVDANTFVAGRGRLLQAYLATLTRPAKQNPLAEELQVAGKHSVVIGLRPSRILQQTDLGMRERERALRKLKGKEKVIRDEKDKARPAVKEEPLEVRSIDEIYQRDSWQGPLELSFKPLAYANRALVTIDVGDEIRGSARLQFAQEDEARDGVLSVQLVLYMARQMVPRLFTGAGLDMKGKEAAAIISSLQADLRNARIERDRTTVQASLKTREDLKTLASTLRDLPSIRRMETDLKMISLSFHNFAVTSSGHFPAPAIVSNEGKPLLSWRVAILPYIDRIPLYRQFKLDEPWDSPHNKKLLSKMPSIYAPLPGKATDPYTTFYQVCTGPNTPFASHEQRQGPSIPRDFPDGTSNTFLVLEASKAVPWTKPEDIRIDPKKPLPKFGGQFDRFFLAGYADGSVRRIRKDADEKMLRCLIDPADGNIIADRELLHP